MTKWKTWALLAAKGVVSFVLITYLIQRVGISNLHTSFQIPSFLAIIGSCLLLTTYFAMNSLRWVIILRALAFKLSLWNVVKITLIAQFFCQFLPSSLGTDLARIWLSTRTGLTTAASINSVLLERITCLAGLSVIAGIVFPLYFGARFPIVYSLSFQALAVLAVIGIGLLTVMDRVPASWLPRSIHKHICQLSADSRSFFRSPLKVFYGLAALVAGQAAFSATLMILGSELGIAIDPLNYLVVAPIVVLVGAIPISIAGWGVRELALVELLTHLGADASRALQLSLTVGVLSLVASLPGALIWIATTHKKKQAGAS